MIRNADQHYRAPKGGGRFGGKVYREGQRIPARYGRILDNGEPLKKDPSAGNEAVPPGYSRDLIPHIWTFQSLISTVSHVYRNPDEAYKHSIENARFMRNDCSIMECLEARQRMCALLNWHIEPDDKDDPIQKTLADDMTKIMKATPYFTEYRRNLQEALWYGKYAIQHIYGFRRINGKKRVVIERWKPINGDKLAFRFDDGSARYSDEDIGIKVSTVWPLKDVVLGNRKLEFTEYGPAYFLETWERTRICVHKHIIEDGAYEDPISSGRIHGVGIRDRIYWCWFQKQETMAHLMEIIERTGNGFTIYYYPAGNAKAKLEMEEVARAQTHTNVILMPRTPGDPAMDAYGIDRIEPSTAGVTVLQDIVTSFFGNQIKRYILGQTLSSEADATGLGSGVADLHLETLLQIIQYDSVKAEETITCQKLQPLQMYNFPWSRGINLKFVIDTESSESETKMRAFKEAWDMGTKIKAADVYDTIGASMPTEDEEVLQNPAMQQQQRLWDQTHGEGGDPMAGGEDGGPPEGPDGEPDMQGMFGPLMDQVGGQDESPEQYAKRLKSAPGQKNLFNEGASSKKQGRVWSEEDEKKHPRADDGEFASKGEEGGNEPAEPDRAKWRENLDADADLRQRKEDEIRLTPEAKQELRERKARKQANKDMLPTDEQVAAEKAKLKEPKADPLQAKRDRLKELTGGKVADKVLNSLSEKALDSSIAVHDKTAKRPTFDELHGKPGGLIDKLKAHDAKNPTPVSSITDVTPEGYGPETPAENDGYFKGDAINLTGQSKEIHGEEFQEFTYLEGHKQGETGWQLSPEAKERKSQQVKAEHEQQQADFRKLAEAQKKAEQESKARAAETAHEAAKAVEAGDASPRDEAIVDTAEKEHSDEYAWARPSEVQNYGEDLMGSARHKVNAWRNLQDAEDAGGGDTFATRSFLAKQMPSNFIAISDDHPTNFLSAMTAHLSLGKFPPKAGFGKRAATAKDRQQYVSAYSRFKAKAEELAKSTHDPQAVMVGLRDEASAMINELRGRKDGPLNQGSDMYNATANALCKIPKALLGRGDSGIKSQLAQFYRNVGTSHPDMKMDPKNKEFVDTVKEHAVSVMEGRSIDKAFGKEAGKSGKSIPRFNPSDAYVTAHTRKGGKDNGANASEAMEHLGGKMKMRGIQYGNSMTDEEREHHAIKATEAFMDMADVTGLSEDQIGMNGKLGLAFGARGRAGAKAHYEPISRNINLTRKTGAGSLAHEWGHFFDNMLGGGAGKFFTEQHYRGEKDTPLDNAFGTWREAATKFKNRIRELARSREGEVAHLLSTGKQLSYWTSDVEMFARSFETYVQAQLKADGRENNYLVGLKKERHPLWPTDEERKEFEPAFKAIFTAYKDSLK